MPGILYFSGPFGMDSDAYLDIETTLEIELAAPMQVLSTISWQLLIH